MTVTARRTIPQLPARFTEADCHLEDFVALVEQETTLEGYPHAAEVAIARLRDATGSRALIRTVVKRGYRLDP